MRVFYRARLSDGCRRLGLNQSSRRPLLLLLLLGATSRVTREEWRSAYRSAAADRLSGCPAADQLYQGFGVVVVVA